MTVITPKPIVQLTDQALVRLRQIIATSSDKIHGVRLGLKNKGCAGMAYRMDYVTDLKIVENDDKVVCDDGKFNLYIERDAVLFIIGTVMDFQMSELKEGFIFTNPNQIDACGCGESVKLQAASSSDGI